MDNDYKTVFLSMGSNLGTRRANLEKALKRLSETGLEIQHISPFYRTEPVDFLDQPEFLNLVCQLKCLESPERLLETCQEIERELGRTCKHNKGPRTVDIDILYYGDSIILKPGLQIPHPGRLLRRFVLKPMAAIAPDFVDPVEKKSVLELLQECNDHSMVNVENE